MTDNHPLVSLITINYNSLKYTLELVESLNVSNYTNWELIIIDNASTDNNNHVFETLGDKVKFHRSEDNLGFAGGNNKGIDISKGDFLFFINNDTEVTPNLIGSLVDKLSSNSTIGLISPKIVYHNTDLIQYAGYTALSKLTLRNSAIGNKQPSADFDQTTNTSFAHGAAMMTRRDVIEKTGKMPELYFLYYEEMDWSALIKKSGYEIWVDQTSVIYHKESMSIGKDSPVKTYYLTRNRILFSRRNRTAFQNFLFFTYSFFIVFPVKTLKYILRREWKHLKSHISAYLWHLQKQNING